MADASSTSSGDKLADLTKKTLSSSEKYVTCCSELSDTELPALLNELEQYKAVRIVGVDPQTKNKALTMDIGEDIGVKLTRILSNLMTEELNKIHAKM